MSGRSPLWRAKRRLIGAPFLLLAGIILMVINPYEYYALFILIGGIIATSLLVYVFLRERKIYQRKTFPPSRHSDSSYQPFVEEIQPYQPAEEARNIQTSNNLSASNFCSYCGQENSDKENFCDNCGQKI
ncbi:MAG: zinc ribbon domain-containing protein [Candidatus Heimdallarchaeota archaeon]|nr:zinc ribbon domain-containing protein [Candidatus Heimdallarchaeota archaeon]MCK4770238.1 zinc ribbon domain-containing protein [Candidatus Heimdallarchaeota archaeon]